MPTPNFETQPRLTQIALTVKNEKLIGDRVLPRMPVTHETYKYTDFPTDERFTVPETAVGRLSMPNEATFSSDLKSGLCKSHALIAPVAISDINLAESSMSGLDPLAIATESTTQLLELSAEKRAADLVFAAGSYASGSTLTLSGDSQWSNTASNPVSAILKACDSILCRPNKLVIGHLAWTQLRQHPKVVESVKSTGAGGVSAQGIVHMQAVADMLELDEILIGKAWYNTQAEGLTPTYNRIWGKHAALIYIDETVMHPQAMVASFGWTATYRGRRVYTKSDVMPGLDGVISVKVSESMEEKVVSLDCGYFFKNIVA